MAQMVPTTSLSTGVAQLNGICGDRAGFWIACYFQNNTVTSPSGFNYTTLVSQTIENGSKGWSLFQYLNALYFQVNGTNGPTYTVLTTDYDRPMLIVGVYTGTGVQLYVSGVSAGTQVGLSAYSPPPDTYSLVIGNSYLSSLKATDKHTVFGVSGGNGTITLAEVQALNSLVESTGRIQGIPGKTDGLWDFSTEVSEKKSDNIDQLTNKAPGGSPLPIQRVGYPKTTKYIQPSGIQVAKGVTGFSGANYLRTAPGMGIQGHPDGFWVGILFQLDASSETGSKVIASCYSSAGGWSIFYNHTINAITLSVYSGGTGFVAPNITLTTSEYNVPLFIAYTYNGVDLKPWFRRAFQTAATNRAFSPAGTSMVVGERINQTTLKDSNTLTVFGVSGGNFTPTESELQQVTDASLRLGKIQSIPGKTDHLYDLAQSYPSYQSILGNNMIECWDAGQGVVQSAGTVTSWTGLNGLAMLPSSQSPYYGVDTGYFKNRPVVQCAYATGVTRALQCNAFYTLIPSGTRPWLLSVFRYRRQDLTAGQYSIFGAGIPGTSDFLLLQVVKATNQSQLRGTVIGTTTWSNGPDPIDTNPHTTQVWHTGTNQILTVDLTDYTLANTSSFQGNATSLSIGKTASGAYHWSNTSHCLHILCRGKPTDAQIAQIKNRVRAEWGVG